MENYDIAGIIRDIYNYDTAVLIKNIPGGFHKKTGQDR